MICISCFHPRLAARLCIKENGKAKIGFVRNAGYSANDFITKHREWFGDKFFPVDIGGVSHYVHHNQLLSIPCGKCVGCRLDKSRQWASRCLLELEQHKSAWFLTLTFDDEHLAKDAYTGKSHYVLDFPVDISTGQNLRPATVDVVDIQRFMKRLRDYTGQPLRYFACGEYGEESNRPHYHLIIFGLDLPRYVPGSPDSDLQFWKYSKSKIKGMYNMIFTSKTVSACWKNGLAVLGSVTFESCAYVARYTLKKSDAQELVDLGCKKPFITMSRKPGIARDYYEKFKDSIYQYDEVIVRKMGEAFPCKPSQYFDRLYDLDNHEDMERIKAHRKEVAANTSQVVLDQTSLVEADKLSKDEERLVEKIKILRRCNDA